MEPGVTKLKSLFINSMSEASQTIRYEKIFLKNKHATETLTNADAMLTADQAACLRIGAAPSIGDSASTPGGNRKSAPTAVSFVDDNVAVQVPTTHALAAGQAIGIWLEQTRAAAAAAVRAAWTVSLAGTTAV